MIKTELVDHVSVSHLALGFEQGLRQELRRTIKRLAIELQSHVKGQKLSGQVLKNRTGTLRRSINQQVVEEGSAIIGKVGTNVVYGRIHEYGYQGPMPVSEHLRLVKQAFGKKLKTPVWATVQAHVRQVNLPERSFLRSSLFDMRDKITRDLQGALDRSKK